MEKLEFLWFIWIIFSCGAFVKAYAMEIFVVTYSNQPELINLVNSILYLTGFYRLQHHAVYCSPPAFKMSSRYSYFWEMVTLYLACVATLNVCAWSCVCNLTIWCPLRTITAKYMSHHMQMKGHNILYLQQNQDPCLKYNGIQWQVHLQYWNNARSIT